jgi:hypothetical protein
VAVEIDEIETWRALWREVRPDERDVAAARRPSRVRVTRKRRVRPVALIVIVVLGTLVTGAALGASGYAPSFWRKPANPAKLTTGVPPTRSAVARGAQRAFVPAPKATAENTPEDFPVEDPLPKPRRTSAPSSSVSEPEPANPWQRAAEALADGDPAAASSAFDELSKSSDASTRDAARLARAQLWIANGESDRARAELRDLAARGSTELIRTRARAALRGLTQRSKAPPAGTNQP